MHPQRQRLTVVEVDFQHLGVGRTPALVDGRAGGGIQIFPEP